nr:immunoglobulin heavy chain junction region [Mus musculus]
CLRGLRREYYFDSW